MQLNKASLLTVLFTSLTIICRICGFIFSPLWLDSISHGGKNTNTSDINTTKEPHDDVTRRTNPYFFAFIQAIIPCTFFMLCYIWIILIKPRLFTDTERTYPKRYIFFAGFSQSLSSLLINYSLSGTRTAPYLQAVLNNFNIPIQFVLRYEQAISVSLYSVIQFDNVLFPFFPKECVFIFCIYNKSKILTICNVKHILSVLV